MRQYGFESLAAWQEARELTVRVYQLTRSFPKDEMFGLSSQVRRAVVQSAPTLRKVPADPVKRRERIFIVWLMEV